MKKSIKRLLIIIWGFVLLFAIYTAADYGIKSYKNKSMYEKMKHSVESVSTETISSAAPETEETTEAQKVILEKYAGLKADNEDFQGWIKIPNTQADYPVYKSSDNEFYLDRDAYKQKNSAGSIFMDYRNTSTIEDKNTILYGHSMKDGSMFAGIMKYKNLEFLKENPIIEFDSLYEERKWEIFSVYITDTEFYYIETDFADVNVYENFLNSVKEKSMFETGVQVTTGDTILTLSTCSYEFDNARFVVHAKLIS